MFSQVYANAVVLVFQDRAVLFLVNIGTDQYLGPFQLLFIFYRIGYQVRQYTVEVQFWKNDFSGISRQSRKHAFNINVDNVIPFIGKTENR